MSNVERKRAVRDRRQPTGTRTTGADVDIDAAVDATVDAADYIGRHRADTPTDPPAPVESSPAPTDTGPSYPGGSDSGSYGTE